MAGYTLGQADLLRRAMGKKKLSELEKAYAGFRQGMLDNNFSEAAIKALWDTVLPFAGYAFNKSHSAGYGLVSYWTAYLKANYPAEYMAGLLTSVGDDKDKSAIYLADCRKLGITVLPPDVNESRVDFATVGDDIRFGMGSVRNVGANVVASIIKARTEKSKFTDFSDYLGKIDAMACNKKVTESLIKAGAFDSLGHPRKGPDVGPCRRHRFRDEAPRRRRRSDSSTSSVVPRRTSRSPRCSTSRFLTKSGIPSIAWRLERRDAGAVCLRSPAQRRRAHSSAAVRHVHRRDNWKAASRTVPR